MSLIEIKNLRIKIKNEILFDDFKIRLEEGECIGIYAPTGKGKTTFLNYIAGIIPDNSGFDISGRLIKNPDMKISYVFQNFGLIQYFSVLENVVLPLRNIYQDNKAVEMAEKMLEKVFLERKINERIIDLSGGEKQRVSIARAFVYPGQVILMDEPFSYQDEDKKEKLMELTKNMIEKEHRSVILISHSLNELEKLCSRIITENEFYCK